MWSTPVPKLPRIKSSEAAQQATGLLASALQVPVDHECAELLFVGGDIQSMTATAIKVATLGANGPTVMTACFLFLAHVVKNQDLQPVNHIRQSAVIIAPV